jgi:hypothetical protein
MVEFGSIDIDEIDLFREKTPEEIEEEKKKRAQELAEKGFLPENEGYHETMSSPQEYVEANPRQFIIEECIPACEELWKKNIYTFMVSDHLNEGECWIEIVYDSLSDENKKIYDKLSGEDVIKFSYHKGTINIGVNKVGLEGQQRLLELAQQFQMQDVPEYQAYITPQDFLINYCDCYDEIPNPEYVEMTAPWDMNLSLEEIAEYLKEYDEWKDSPQSKETIKVFNPDKQTKPLEELVLEHNMILEGERVYLSQFHYDKHQNYIDSLNKGKDTIKL